MVSIVVPTYNEEKNIRNLCALLDYSFEKNSNNYEIIVVDDNSTDNTLKILKELESKYSLQVFTKAGKKGKAYSLIEGFAKARGDIIAMIDADLQYPPQEIPQMIKKLRNSDIVVANRKTYNDTPIRKVFSRGFKKIFGKTLFNLDCDIQSGLKIFKKKVIESIKFTPGSAWSFDLEFLHKAQEAGFTIAGHDITFYARGNGSSKIAILKTAFELGTNALILKAKRSMPVSFAPHTESSMKGAGVGFKKKQYVTHTTLSHDVSALRAFLLWQKLLILLIISSLSLFFYISALKTAIALVAGLSTIYFADVLFNFLLTLRSLQNPPEIAVRENDIKSLDEKNLPLYTILCPLYKEAAVLEGFLKAVNALDWPKNKLEVLLLLEEDDKETIEKADKIGLPSYVKKIIVPDSLPKTKPKACNFGLAHANGEYLVIYDAEDIPEPNQLKKAYLAFNQSPKNVVCLQAKLNYHNPHQNLLTRFFTAEYSLWFDVTLTGLQSIGTVIPLGGTSNHFRTSDLIKLLGWDPFNVTEDADLGARLFRSGFKTAIIDSTTLEEANSKFGNWFRQRSRWIKGYMQTYLVQMRNPVSFVSQRGVHALFFQLTVGGKIAFMFINPILWATTIAYFAAYSIVGPTIESLYPPIIFYMAATSLVFGNFLFMYYYMLGCAKRGHYSLIKYVFLVPFYWLAVSAAATVALYQLVRKPHFWEKTVHGLNMPKPQDKKIDRQTIPVLAGSPSPRWAWASGAFLISASIIANFFNFAYNAYLGRRINIEEFGLISLVGSFLYISSIPIGALGSTVNHKSAYFFGKYNHHAANFWQKIRKNALVFSLAITLLWLLICPFLANFFNTTSLVPFLIFAPVWTIAALSSVDSGFLSGNLKFKYIAVLMLTEAICRFSIAVALVEGGFSQYVYASLPISMFVSLCAGYAFAKRLKKAPDQIEKKINLNFPKQFYFTSVFTKLSTIAFLTFDVILAKHFLPPTEAGQYALLSLIGKMIFFVVSLFDQFTNTLISRAEGAKKNSQVVFMNIFLIATVTSFLAYLVVGYFGAITTPILFGAKVLPIVGLLPAYGLAMLCFALSSTIVNFYQAKRKHMLAYVSFAVAAFQILAIASFHANISQIVNVMDVIGVASLILMVALHVSYEQVAAISRNFAYMLGLFENKDTEEHYSKKLNILIFNWRDTKHVWAGGAEVYIHELSRKLVRKNHSITIFCGNDGQNKNYEEIDGIKVYRRGGFYTVYIWALLYYIFKFRGKYDIVIDSENGIPFFTPLFVKEPIIGLIHHVHQEVFRGNLILPLALLGKFLEGRVMPFVYKNVKVVTVSNSSKLAIEKIGLGKNSPVEVVNPGIDTSKFKPGSKTATPSILYLGRLKPYKSVETAILAMQMLVKNIPNVTLTIGGEGESRPILEELTEKLKLQKAVKFIGHVTEKQKAALYSKSWVMVQPSTIEGWGITAIEANASGTPVVASNVPGLRDSVMNPHTGYLVKPKDHDQFALKLEKIILDKRIRRELERGSIEWANNFSWNKSADSFLEILEAKLELSRKYQYQSDLSLEGVA